MAHASSLFTADATTKTFTVDISDLPRPAFHRIYDDAADLGMTLVSAKTSKEAVFVIDREFHDVAGELQGWILVPTPAMLARYRLLRGWTIIVYND